MKLRPLGLVSLMAIQWRFAVAEREVAPSSEVEKRAEGGRRILSMGAPPTTTLPSLPYHTPEMFIVYSNGVIDYVDKSKVESSFLKEKAVVMLAVLLIQLIVMIFLLVLYVRVAIHKTNAREKELALTQHTAELLATTQ